jgi:hypothetical protein
MDLSHSEDEYLYNNNFLSLTNKLSQYSLGSNSELIDLRIPKTIINQHNSILHLNSFLFQCYDKNEIYLTCEFR